MEGGRSDGWDGNINLHSIASHYSKDIENGGTTGAPNLKLAGQNYSSVPLWRVNSSEAYSNDLWSLTFSERYISAGVVNKAWIQCNPGTCPVPIQDHPTVNDNRMAGAMYFDLGGTYNMPAVNGFNSQFFFKIDNVNNIDPPPDFQQGSNQVLSNGYNGQLYDELGRFYRIGVRINTN